MLICNPIRLMFSYSVLCYSSWNFMMTRHTDFPIGHSIVGYQPLHSKIIGLACKRLCSGKIFYKKSNLYQITSKCKLFRGYFSYEAYSPFRWATLLLDALSYGKIIMRIRQKLLNFGPGIPHCSRTEWTRTVTHIWIWKGKMRSLSNTEEISRKKYDMKKDPLF